MYLHFHSMSLQCINRYYVNFKGGLPHPKGMVAEEIPQVCRCYAHTQIISFAMCSFVNIYISCIPLKCSCTFTYFTVAKGVHGKSGSPGIFWRQIAKPCSG